MKTHLSLIFTFLLIYSGTSQTKEPTEKIIRKFVITVVDEVTQNFAEIDQATTDSLWSKSNQKFDNSDIQVPMTPSVLVYKKQYEIHFHIKPKLYTQYTIECSSDKKVSNILKVDRETLMGSNFNPYTFTLEENQWDFKRHTEDEFEILEYFKNDKKIICGFECYKVKVQSKRGAKRIMEMYVTENIKLNYNPAFPNPHLLKIFYPLYVKEYLENYPDDVYKEYIFELE